MRGEAAEKSMLKTVDQFVFAIFVLNGGHTEQDNKN